jgi:hypothetical protein
MASHPGVYTSVAYHYDFIKSIVCSYGLTDTMINLCSTPSANIDEPDPMCLANGVECYDSLECCENSECHQRDGICVTTPRENKVNEWRSILMFRNRFFAKILIVSTPLL